MMRDPKSGRDAWMKVARTSAFSLGLVDHASTPAITRVASLLADAYEQGRWATQERLTARVAELEAEIARLTAENEMLREFVQEIANDTLRRVSPGIQALARAALSGDAA